MIKYDCIIVGGGIAGLQTAVQLGRYRRSVLVLDAGEGRSSLCRCYHNLLGWPDGVAGRDLRLIGRLQAERLGVVFANAEAVRASDIEGGIGLSDAEGNRYEARRLLIATGVKDRIPDRERVRPYLGVSLFICPDCDGYGATGRRTLVLGSGSSGASMALTVRYWADEIVYVNEDRGEIGGEHRAEMERLGIDYREGPVGGIEGSGGQLKGVTLADGSHIPATYGFVSYGGNEVRSELAKQLGVELAGNRHIVVHPRTKRTSHPLVWAAGDVTPHSEQAAIAMGDGAQAAIWLHKSMLLEERGAGAGEINWP